VATGVGQVKATRRQHRLGRDQLAQLVDGAIGIVDQALDLQGDLHMGGKDQLATCRIGGNSLQGRLDIHLSSLSQLALP